MTQTHAHIPVPQHIQRAADKLGWTILQTDRYGGDTAYLVRDNCGITEPYTAPALLQSAAVVQCNLYDHPADRECQRLVLAAEHSPKRSQQRSVVAGDRQ